MLSLKLLGGARVETDRGRVAGRCAQRHQIALLALLATAPGHILNWMRHENAVEVNEARRTSSIGC